MTVVKLWTVTQNKRETKSVACNTLQFTSRFYLESNEMWRDLNLHCKTPICQQRCLMATLQMKAVSWLLCQLGTFLFPSLLLRGQEKEKAKQEGKWEVRHLVRYVILFVLQSSDSTWCRWVLAQQCQAVCYSWKYHDRGNSNTWLFWPALTNLSWLGLAKSNWQVSVAEQKFKTHQPVTGSLSSCSLCCQIQGFPHFSLIPISAFHILERVKVSLTQCLTW